MSSSLLARTGRHHQRYEDNLRLVSGCIPYRILKESDCESGCKGIENRLEVLMVSTPNRDDLVFPKGGWEDDETVEEAARREALEEAGVRGIIDETPLGVWEFRSKSSQELCSLEGGCKGYMFALQVTEELDTWPEQENHSRRWLNVKEAFQLCRYDWMRTALEKFVRVLTETGRLETTAEKIPSSSPAVSEVVPDCQILTTNFCVNPSTTQHNGLTQFSWFVPVKNLPLV